MVTLLGPSGCGQTTILRPVAGLENRAKGKFSLMAKTSPIALFSSAISVWCFSPMPLFPHMSLGENVGYGLKMLGVPRAELKARVKEALAMVDLEAI